MKKAISLLLCVALLFSLMAIPTLAGEPEYRPQNSLGGYYKFTFGADGDQYDYNAVLDQPITYKNQTFYPFYYSSNYTADNIGVCKTEYTTMTGSNGTIDVLRLETGALAALTPMTADGTPYEVLPGHTYQVKINAYQEVAVPYDRAYFVMGNVSYKWWNNPEQNNYVKGVESGDSVDSSVRKGVGRHLPISARGMSYNDGNNTKRVFGTTTDTAAHFQKTKYMTVPQPGEGEEMTAVYDEANDSVSFTFPVYTDSALNNAKGSNITYNNFFYLWLGGRYFVDADGNNCYFAYDIESIEIWDMSTVKVTVADMTYAIEKEEVAGLVGTTPVLPSGHEFLGWYLDEAYTNPLTAANASDATEVYAKTKAAASLTYYDGTTALGESVTGLNVGDTYNFDRVAPAKSGFYFAGWYDNAECKGASLSQITLKTGENRVYAKYVPYPTNLTVTMKGNDSSSTVSYPSYNASMSPAYSVSMHRTGWSCRGVADGVCRFYTNDPWPAAGAYVLSDENGNAFVADSNTTYDITVEYKVNNIVKSEEVGTLPDGSTYGGGYVQMYVGIGMAAANRNDLKDKGFSYHPPLTKMKEETDWKEETFTVTTGNLSNQLPVVGVYVNCAGLPKRYKADGTPIGQPGDTKWGANELYVRKVTVKKRLTFRMFDETGSLIRTSYIPAGNAVTQADLMPITDVIHADGTGYSAIDAQWFFDKDYTQPVDLATLKAEADTDLYGKMVTLQNGMENQVSYYGFDDLWYNADKGLLGGFTLGENGKNSYQYLQATGKAGPANVAPNALLDDEVTYAASFWYKATKATQVQLGNQTLTLPAATDWTAYNTPVNCVNGKITVSVLSDSGTVALDDFGLYQPLTSAGASILLDAEAAENDSQAMRVYYRYFPESGAVKLGNEALTVVKRGVLLMDEALAVDLLTPDTDGVTEIAKTDDLDTCWSYDNGELLYSVYIKDFKQNDTRLLTVRGYVQLSDGNLYYSTQENHSVAELEKLNALYANENVYALHDAAVLDKVVLNERYEVLDNGVTFDWTGATLRFNARCVGEVTLKMLVNPGSLTCQTYLTVYVDGQRVGKRFVVPVYETGEKEYTFTLDVGWSSEEHTIEICRQNEAGMGYMTLMSLSMNGELGTAQEKECLVEFIGDSITCGQGNLTTVARNEVTSAYSDGTSAYAFLAARELDVDYRMVSGSGRGVLYSSGGSTGVGASWLQTYGIENDRRSKTQAYESKRKADVVCLYLGTNDTYGRSINDNVNFTDEELTKGMEDLMDVVHSYNPDASIVWVTGGITRSYKPMAEAAIANKGGEAAGYYLFDFSKSGLQSGGAWHPTGEDQALMATELAAFLRDKGLTKKN